MAEAKTPDQIAREMQQRYRNVFGTVEGKIVLADILFTLGHFGTMIDPKDSVAMTELQFAINIARTAQAFGPLYQHLGIAEGKEN
jgi:hypothetical protein